ncbi:MAG: undecaprenyl phosphate translocase family protein [Fusobacteriaceae bacterium]
MFLLFLKGIGIGVANIMPGVSGGTLAVVFGVYDKLLEAIGNFYSANKEKKIKFLKFLSPIIVGACFGIIIFAKILQYLYINFPTLTGIAFLLLILPSIPLIIKNEKFNLKNCFSLLSGIIITFIFILLGVKYGSKINEIGMVKSFTTIYGLKLFFSGTIAAGAMIIPGISGSLLLLMLGEYYNIIFSINKCIINILLFLKGDSNMSFWGTITSGPFLNLSVFLLGIIIGIITVSKFITFMLNNYRSITLYFINGIIITSLLQILMNIFPAIDNMIKTLIF